jgi:hypothetical protein
LIPRRTPTNYWALKGEGRDFIKKEPEKNWTASATILSLLE